MLRVAARLNVFTCVLLSKAFANSFSVGIGMFCIQKIKPVIRKAGHNMRHRFQLLANWLISSHRLCNWPIPSAFTSAPAQTVRSALSSTLSPGGHQHEAALSAVPLTGSGQCQHVTHLWAAFQFCCWWFRGSASQLLLHLHVWANWIRAVMIVWCPWDLLLYELLKKGSQQSPLGLLIGIWFNIKHWWPWSPSNNSLHCPLLYVLLFLCSTERKKRKKKSKAKRGLEIFE